MTNYNTLLTKHCKKHWEDLTNKEKEMLVNGYVLSKPIVIPNEVRFQKAILSTLDFDLGKQDLLETFTTVRNYLFQAIKEDIERDLEREEIEETDADEWLDSINEQLKDLKEKKIKHMSDKILKDYEVNGHINI